MTSIRILSENPVYFYTDSEIAPYGQGSSIRQYSNLRAYLDLGFKVEVVQFVDRNGELRPATTVPFPEITWTRVDYASKQLNLWHKLVGLVGFPKRMMLNVLWPVRPFVVRQVRLREEMTPNAIHHFEYDNIASAAASFSRLNAIWSNHDILSMRIPLLRQMRRELLIDVQGDRSDARRIRQLIKSEKWIAGHCKLILNIAKHEYAEFHIRRRFVQAELFPMSWPHEDRVPRQRDWMADGKLRLLHLGSVDGFVGYDSLRFILEHVFPLLTSHQLDRIELLAVGKVTQSVFSQQIRKLAGNYPQVKFLGYVDDIRKVYAQADLQVVGGIRATGLRTRIIESFAYGLPVLSTSISARGVACLSLDDNIFLAEDARIFTSKLVGVLLRPAQLADVADRARQTYDEHFSRPVVAEKLRTFLEKCI